jgi:general secretion pathway protein I
MVALFIFAVTGTAILKTTAEHLNSLGKLEEITFATWVANNRLTHLKIDTTWPVKNNHSGEQEMAGRTWHWKQLVEKTNDTEMVMVEVLVSTDQSFDSSVTSVTGFITKPQ